MKIKYFLITLVIVLTGCSSKELYEASKINREANCNKYVGQEREQCLREINRKSYEEYERERQEVLSGKEN